MPSSSETGLVIPMRGSHVTIALAEARLEGDAFWGNERRWLEEHNPLLWQQTCQLFEKLMRASRGASGVGNAEASVVGRFLANRSVRLCVDGSPEEYLRASINYQEHRDFFVRRNSVPRNLSLKGWENEGVLTQAFADTELISALMDIKTDRSRHSAAVALGYFCLEKVPVIT